MKFKCVVCTVSLTAISLFTFTAHSGQVLKLKAGNIKMDSKSSRSRMNAVTGSHEFVIQFAGSITESDRAQLQDLGLKVLGYIPEDALIVYGSSEAVKAAQTLNTVRAVEVMNPEWKMSSDFAASSVFTRENVVRSHVRISDASFVDTVQSSLSQIPGLRIQFALDKVIVADIPQNEVATVASIVGVEWMEPLAQIQTMDFDTGLAPQRRTSRASATGYESGTRIMGFENAWARGFDGAGQVAAMTDTGLDTGDLKTIHKDLSNTKEGMFVSGFGGNLPFFSWKDTVGHGTHVAGSIVGNGALSNGLIRGGAYRADFIAQGVAIGDMLNPLALQSPKHTLDPALAKKAFVHSNSWGADSKGAYDAMAAAYDDYLWNHPEMLVVFAAGNSGLDTNKDGRIDEGSVGSPGTAKNVMTVGASENFLSTGGIQRAAGQAKPGADGEPRWPAEPIYSDTFSNNADGMAAFSSRGPTADGRLKPDVVAPGTNIVSARSSVIKVDPQNPNAEPLWGVYDSNYLYCGGTSMATPLASGAATVARQYLEKVAGVSAPSGAMVKASLIHTAHDMYPGQYGTGPKQELPTQRPNVHEGYGRVDVDKLTALKSTVFVDEKAGVGLNEEKVITVQSNGDMTVTLVYTDAPGTASAQKALVNDIDLTVIAPDGRVFTKNDRVNNTEMIELKGGPAGEYKVKVSGTNIPQGKNGKQPYALIASPY